MTVKQFLLFCLLIGQSISCQAQDELFLSLDQGEYFCYGHQFVDNEYQVTFNSLTNEIKIYDEQFSVIKKLTYQPNSVFNLVVISYLSKGVFNVDDKFEFLIQTVDAKGQTQFQIINGDNEVIMNNEARHTYIMNVGTQAYIVVRDTDMQTDKIPVRVTNTDKLYKVNGRSRIVEW